jgi:hypothetical protein
VAAGRGVGDGDVGGEQGAPLVCEVKMMKHHTLHKQLCFLQYCCCDPYHTAVYSCLQGVQPDMLRARLYITWPLTLLTHHMCLAPCPLPCFLLVCYTCCPYTGGQPPLRPVQRPHAAYQARVIRGLPRTRHSHGHHAQRSSSHGRSAAADRRKRELSTAPGQDGWACHLAA